MTKKGNSTYYSIKSLEAQELKKRSLTIRIADNLTSYFGTIGFFVLNVIVFTFWIVANLGYIPGVAVFDPYPFVLLITAVSLEAILLTTIVLMSQNRQSHISTLREELDMQVNLISEREISKALFLLSKLLEKQGIKIKDEELAEMLDTLDATYIEKKIEKQLEEQNKRK